MGAVSYAKIFAARAAEAPDRVALVCEDEELTRSELASRSNRLARDFAARGVAPGSLVTIGLPNSVDFVVACMAAWKCGAVPNPISPRLPEREGSEILELASPALVVGLDDLVHRFPTLPEGHVPYASVGDAPLPDAISPHERAIASGGSTGRPKLILVANPALHDPDRPATILSPKGCVLVPGPLYHAAPFGSLTQGLLAGEKVVVMRRFDASRCLELVERHRVEQILFVPTMMHRIWRLSEAERGSRDVSSLRIVFTGSAACPEWLMRAWIEWLGPDVMHELFGGTERIGGSMISGREWLEHPGSVGKPTPATKIRILDPETGEDVDPGEVGEIYMLPASGQGSTYRYVGADPRAIDGGWESLGDMGRFDADGYLYLADRRTDMILSGGRNIYPAQVEAALDEHPAVASSAVIGLPDEDMGQRVHAIVQLEAAGERSQEPIDERGDEPTGERSGVGEEELRAHLTSRLVHYAIPRSFEFVDQPLRDESGKLRRYRLREERIGSGTSR